MKSSGDISLHVIARKKAKLSDAAIRGLKSKIATSLRSSQ
jgi:hypothetical protein